MCGFMQADSSSETYARPPKEKERDGWIWRLHGAMNGMRTASRAATELLVGILTERMGLKRDEMRWNCDSSTKVYTKLDAEVSQ